MSESRPKLVQEGLPLTNANPKDSKSLSTLASSSAGNAGTSTKSKFRIVIGGENENAELPDDPDQYRYSGYHHGPNNFAMNNPHHYSAPYYPRPGRGGGNFYRGGRGGRYDTGYFRGRGSYDTRNYDHSYDIRNRAYDHYHQFNRVYDNHYNTYPDHNDNYKFGKRIIKNPKSPGLIQSRFVIGQGNGDQNNNSNSELSTVDDEILMELEEVIPQTYNEELHQIERMEGVISLDALEPLVVIDGANVAYAYADAISAVAGTNQREPDHRGIQVAVDYFQQASIRVLVVLPAPWFRLKPRPGDAQSGNALMLTEKVEILKNLKDQGLLVAAPPKDDDDAYVLSIAHRDRVRAKERGQESGYVLSNDMYRDAMARNPNMEQWLQREWGRVSFAFCDLGSRNDYGQQELDFIPNPRHPMIMEIERQKYFMADGGGGAGLSASMDNNDDAVAGP